MIISKQLNGGVYVALVDVPVDSETPGVVHDWYFIGPGQSPHLTWVGGTEWVVSFTYLSVQFTRVIDLSNWPPQQVDPVTYNPISIQRPEIWVPVPTNSVTISPAQGARPDYVVVKRDNPYLFFNTETGIITLTVSRDTLAKTPGDLTRKGYRLYVKNMDTNLTSLVMDWSSDISSVSIQAPHPARLSIFGTWGDLWKSGGQNYLDTNPLGWYEHDPGPSVLVDSTTESLTYTVSVSTQFSSLTDPASLSDVWMTEFQTFYAQTYSEALSVGYTDTSGFPTFMGTSVLVDIPPTSDQVTFNSSNQVGFSAFFF